jgi:prolyl-tRNA synthetase
MLRAGLIRQLGAGVYDYLPLGWRSLYKAINIVRDEMNNAGAVEVLLPTLQPIELWEQTGRRTAYGDNLLVVKDRHGRTQALGPTHEEVITELVAGSVESYKQLPLTLYQIQTKFRDEFRPRFGVLRSREFQMKDAYSFHTSLEGPGGLNETYDKQYAAYCRIFERCGIPYRAVEAESGPIGGSASHEFMVPSPTGEDTILESDKGNYAANVEKCEIGTRGTPLHFLPFTQGKCPAAASDAKPPGALEKVHTPNVPGIDDVCAFMKVKPKFLLKTLVFEPVDEQARKTTPYVIAVVRGDQDVNEGKLKTVAGLPLQLADLARAKAAGFAVGFVGPAVITSRSDARLIIDPDATLEQFWVTGANEIDHHVKHFDWQREVLAPLGDAATNRILVADIRNAVAGDPSPKNDSGTLRVTKGIEIGHVFKLGTKYTAAMNVTVLMPDNTRINPIMGCYGIGINRILASAIERAGGHDADGIIWPAAIAPYRVVITPIKYDGPVKDAVDKLAAELEAAGFAGDVLIDDRDERPGVKFKDADLIGIPLRFVIGDKGLATGQVELKARTSPKAESIAITDAVKRAQELIATL